LAFSGIRLGQTCRNDNRLPKSPSASSCLCARVNRQPVEKRVSILPSKVRPSDGQIARRVASTELAEIDNCGQPTLTNEQVPQRYVSMNPDRRPTPTRSKRSFPNCQRSGGIDFAGRRSDCLLELLVVDHKVAATEEVLLAGSRTILGWHTMQGAEESREVYRKLTFVCWR
jgi:hypothetical protein